MKTARKIVQIAFEVGGDDDSTYSLLHALADDGTIWFYRNHEWKLWIDTPLPQDETEEPESK